MKKKTVLFLLIMVCGYSVNAQKKVEKLTVYKSFLRGGTIDWVASAFENPPVWIDTTNINVGENLFLNEFSQILFGIRPRRHFPQKFGGISIAGEFWIDSKRHFFILFEPPGLLIDVTNRREYRIRDEAMRAQIQNWINSLPLNQVSIPCSVEAVNNKTEN